MQLSVPKAISYLNALVEQDRFEKMDDWERDFVASMIRLFANGSIMRLSRHQKQKIAEVYCKYVLLPKLPADFRKAPVKKKATP